MAEFILEDPPFGIADHTPFEQLTIRHVESFSAQDAAWILSSDPLFPISSEVIDERAPLGLSCSLDADGKHLLDISISSWSRALIISEPVGDGAKLQHRALCDSLLLADSDVVLVRRFSRSSLIEDCLAHIII